jgi:hypothetical protein
MSFSIMTVTRKISSAKENAKMVNERRRQAQKFLQRAEKRKKSPEKK